MTLSTLEEDIPRSIPCCSWMACKSDIKAPYIYLQPFHWSSNGKFLANAYYVLTKGVRGFTLTGA